jgi:Fur family transcriptional regulator, ferric uptake regulator
MTTTAAIRPTRATSVGAAVDALRAHGLRITTQRRVLLEALYAAEQPLTAEALAGDADLASAYRNLDAFESVGLVRHLHLGHGPGRFALRQRGAWAACEACGRHAPLPAAALSRLRLLVREATGLDAGFEHFPLLGLCPECANVH